MPALIILRFFAGIFASSGPGLGIATVSDVFSPQERGSPISIYALGPMAGPGPSAFLPRRALSEGRR